MKYSKILLFMTALLCLAFQACAQPVSDNQINTMGSSGDYLSPNISPGGYYPNFPWYTTGGSFYSQPYSDTTFSPVYTVLYINRYASSGWNNQQPGQVRYYTENSFQCVLGHRPGIAVHPICIHSAIQDQRPLDPGSDKLDTICGNTSRNLAAAGRQCASWRACGLL